MNSSSRVLSTLFIVFTLLLSSNVFAADLEGFMGLPWGSSKEAVSELIKSKGGTIDLKNSNDGKLVFDDVLFAGKKVSFIQSYFIDNRLCAATVCDVPDKEFEAIEIYERWKKQLTEKYGNPSKQYKYFIDPYKEGDGYEIQAIKNGKGKFSSFWFFEKSGTKEDQGSVSLELNSNTASVINYEDTQLLKMYLEKKSKANQKDL